MEENNAFTNNGKMIFYLCSSQYVVKITDTVIIIIVLYLKVIY